MNLCPVCRQAVKPTLRQNIPAHLDSIREDTCPGTGEPFRIAVTVTLGNLGVNADKLIERLQAGEQLTLAELEVVRLERLNHHTANVAVAE